jgi:hypothetical protein
MRNSTNSVPHQEVTEQRGPALGLGRAYERLDAFAPAVDARLVLGVLNDRREDDLAAVGVHTDLAVSRERAGQGFGGEAGEGDQGGGVQHGVCILLDGQWKVGPHRHGGQRPAILKGAPHGWKRGPALARSGLQPDWEVLKRSA